MAIFWVRVEGRVLRFYRASFRVVFGTSNIRFVVGGSGTILAFRDIPTLTWIDDFYVVNFGSTRLLEAAKQGEAALVATYVALEVFCSAG